MLITAIANLAVQGPDGRHIFDPAKDLGRAYNEVFDNCAQPGDWVCLLDHDAIWTTDRWYLQILDAIRENPNAGIITAMTNRIGRPEQVCKDAPAGHDMAAHRAYGARRLEQYGSQVHDITRGGLISGVVLCLSHETWEQMGGFRSPANGTAKAAGFYGLDNHAHRDAARLGKRVLIMKGLYVYHWYRGDKRKLSAPKVQV